MKENTVERFKIEKINRGEIHGAPYNPRKISEAAAKKLKAELKDIGLLVPIVVNRNSMNIVSGHQRLSAMDSIMRTDDYMVTVAMVGMDEKEEIKANILMNNTSVMGEWDIGKLSEIHLAAPEFDFIKDFGFDQSDIDYMFAGNEEICSSFDTPTEEKTEIDKMAAIDAFKAAKKSQREKIQAKEANNGDTWSVSKDDNLITIVFNTNAEKIDFMMRAHHPINEKFVKPSILFDIASGKIKLFGKEKDNEDA